MRDGRKARGQALQTVASALGMGIATLSRLERGDLDDIGARRLLRVADYLGLQLVVRPAGHGMTLDEALEDAARDFTAQGQGALERQGAAGCVFAYLPQATANDFASLLMPVRLESYAVASALIPTFQQNLPEGFLRRRITERFGKVLATDDFVLLALTGANPIGRQRAVPSGFARDRAEPLKVDIPALMADVRVGALFADLLDQFIGFGVSGALPKVLVQECATIHNAHWILKAGDEKLPGLVVNEFFTMRAAQLAGLQVPEFKLADNGSLFPVKRFDHDEAGNALGFEDFCALLAMPPERKYGGTMERIFKAVDAYAGGPERLQAKESLIAAHLFSMAAGNTDAHLKNFGLVYANASDVRLAPMFDMVTTRCTRSTATTFPRSRWRARSWASPTRPWCASRRSAPA